MTTLRSSNKPFTMSLYQKVHLQRQKWVPWLLNSHEWPKQNFSLQYQYNIKQTSDENKEKYQSGDYQLIQKQILQINIIRFVWQTERRITNEIWGVKGLTLCTLTSLCIFSILFSIHYLGSKKENLENHQELR